MKSGNLWKMSVHKTTIFIIILFFLTACAGNTESNESGGNEVENTAIPPTEASNVEEGSTSETDAGYPMDVTDGYPADSADAAYPVSDIYDDLSDAPPNPDVDLPSSTGETAVLGGVLIREVVGEGFEPLVPLSVSLAEIVLSSDGKPAFISAGDTSLKAELYPTGIFIFQNVPPGEYGFMIDVGYTQFFIKAENDSETPMLVDVNAGDVIDLGQIITELPSG